MAGDNEDRQGDKPKEEGQSRQSCCPCEHFCTPERVLGAISSENETEMLISWIEGEIIKEEGEEFILLRQADGRNIKPCHAGSYGRCPNRVGAAFAILNAIRDECRRHLDRQSMASSRSSAALLSLAPPSASSSLSLEDATSPVKPARYEDAFPSLKSTIGGAASLSVSELAPNVLIPRKKKKKKKKKHQVEEHIENSTSVQQKQSAGKEQKVKETNANANTKRRIRPVSISSVANTSLSPWPGAGIAPSSNKGDTSVIRGNIAKLPSEDPGALALNVRPPSMTLNRQQVKIGSHQEVMGMRGVSSDPFSVFNVPPPPGLEIPTSSKPKIVTPRKLDGSFAKSDELFEVIGGPSCQCNDTGHGNGVSRKGIDRETRAWDSASLGRTVSIYTALISNLLVPSVPLELHLLLRLLSLSPTKDTAQGEPLSFMVLKEKNQIEKIFASPQACREFAIRALEKLENPLLSSLSEIIVNKMVMLPSMNEFLPDTVSRLRVLVEATNKGDGRDDLKNGSAGVSIAGASKTPFLTVPFNESRDSRHNYRSREQTVLFNNREESRDKFMFQLRAFQEIRGTVLDPSQADVYISEMKTGCREMMNGLLPGNIAWFAGLFSDLLLQIGLVAMEETDKEVLKRVTDKDRLKKLHRRFTAKGGQKNRSSQKLILDQRSETAASSSASQPEHYFSGHQEFFFVFLRAVDSYQFAIQLRRRFIGVLDKMNATAETRSLEDQIARMQLLAKFLGLLLFSPNWNTFSATSIKSNTAQGIDSEEALVHLNCTKPAIDVHRYVEESWRTERLVVTIPWVVEYLRMALWDKVSLMASYYQKVFALLRAIQKRLERCPHTGDALSTLRTVNFQLEVLFSDVLGLVKTERLPIFVLPDRRRSTKGFESGDDLTVDSLDKVRLQFSRTYLFSSSMYLEEFYKLISEILENRGKPVGRVGASKKLRPYAIATDANSAISTSPFSKHMDSLNGALGSTDSTQLNSPQKMLISPKKLTNSQRNNSIQDKLIDSFFHQHNDLQQICEFVVEKSVKKMESIIEKDIIVPMLTMNPDDFEQDFDLFLKAIRQKEKGALASARESLKTHCEHCIRMSLQLLSPSDTKSEVLDMAVILSIRHAYGKGEESIDSSLRKSAQSHIDLYMKKQAKVKNAFKHAQAEKSLAPISENKKSLTANDQSQRCLRHSAAILSRLVEEGCQLEGLWNISQRDQSTFAETRAEMSKATQSGELEWTVYCGIEEEGRKFSSLFLILIEAWLSASATEKKGYPPLFVDAMMCIVYLAKAGVPYFGLKRIGTLFCEKIHLILEWDELKVGDSALLPILCGLLKSKVTTPRGMERVLTSLSEGGGKYGSDIASLFYAEVEEIYPEIHQPRKA